MYCQNCCFSRSTIFMRGDYNLNSYKDVHSTNFTDFLVSQKSQHIHLPMDTLDRWTEYLCTVYFTKENSHFSLCNLGLSPSEHWVVTLTLLTASNFCNYLVTFAQNISLLHSLERLSIWIKSHFFCLNPTIKISIPLSTFQYHSLWTNLTISSL